MSNPPGPECTFRRTVKRVLFSGFSGPAGDQVWMAYPPTPLRRQSEAIEVEIDYGRGVEVQHLTHEQSAGDRNAEWAAQFGALAEADCQRQCAEHRRHCCHHDRPKALEAGFIDRLARAQPLVSLGIECKV